MLETYFTRSDCFTISFDNLIKVVAKAKNMSVFKTNTLCIYSDNNADKIDIVGITLVDHDEIVEIISKIFDCQIIGVFKSNRNETVTFITE